MSIDLPAGTSVLVAKVVDTGGPGGFYHRALPRAEELAGDLVALLLPEEACSEELRSRTLAAWRTGHSPDYKHKVDRIAELEDALDALEATVPRTMVMQELAEPRETFVLMRGAYDKPDARGRSRAACRPRSAACPKALRSIASASRSGCSRRRTRSSRAWPSTVCGRCSSATGLVRTSEDFGLQGEWPSHPELLDWLAVEFRESGWDVQHILQLCVTSRTYRQSSRVRPDVLRARSG